MTLTDDAEEKGWRKVLHPWACRYANESVWLCPECVERLKTHLMNEREDRLALLTRDFGNRLSDLYRQVDDLKTDYHQRTDDVRRQADLFLKDLL